MIFDSLLKSVCEKAVNYLNIYKPFGVRDVLNTAYRIFSVCAVKNKAYILVLKETLM